MGVTQHPSEDVTPYVGRVSSALREVYGAAATLELAACRSLAYSLSLRFDVRPPHAAPESVFVKIRRASRFGTYDPEARGGRAARLAREEHELLLHVRDWARAHDPTLGVVEPLAYLDDCNALLTRGARGEGLDGLVSANAPLALPAIVRAGRWLHAFHLQMHRAEQVPWDAAIYIDRVARLAADLRASGADEATLDALLARVKSLAARYGGLPCPHSRIHGDFKLRHVWADAQGLQVLDFGNSHRAPIVVDLAAFLVELEVLELGAWTTSSVPFMVAGPVFLEAYGPLPAPGILSLQLIHARLKKWGRRRVKFSSSRVARRLEQVLQRTGTARAVRLGYIDPFFLKRLEMEVAWLESREPSFEAAVACTGVLARTLAPASKTGGKA